MAETHTSQTVLRVHLVGHQKTSPHMREMLPGQVFGRPLLNFEPYPDPGERARIITRFRIRRPICSKIGLFT